MSPSLGCITAALRLSAMAAQPHHRVSVSRRKTTPEGAATAGRDRPARCRFHCLLPSSTPDCSVKAIWCLFRPSTRQGPWNCSRSAPPSLPPFSWRLWMTDESRLSLRPLTSSVLDFCRFLRWKAKQAREQHSLDGIRHAHELVRISGA